MVKISASHAEVAGFNSRTNYLIVWSNGSALRINKILVCLARDTGSIPVTIVMHLWRNGRRSRFKICRWQHRVGSNPTRCTESICLITNTFLLIYGHIVIIHMPKINNIKNPRRKCLIIR